MYNLQPGTRRPDWAKFRKRANKGPISAIDQFILLSQLRPELTFKLTFRKLTLGFQRSPVSWSVVNCPRSSVRLHRPAPAMNGHQRRPQVAMEKRQVHTRALEVDREREDEDKRARNKVNFQLHPGATLVLRLLSKGLRSTSKQQSIDAPIVHSCKVHQDKMRMRMRMGMRMRMKDG